MSPAMLTLVAAVLVYDMAREMCEVRDAPSSMVEAAAETPPPPPRRSDRSCTRLENDIVEDAGMVEPRGGLGLRCDSTGGVGGRWRMEAVGEAIGWATTRTTIRREDSKLVGMASHQWESPFKKLRPEEKRGRREGAHIKVLCGKVSVSLQSLVGRVGVRGETD